MRLFSFIWIIIILAAYVVPCSDATVMEDNTSYESVEKTAGHHQNEVDGCSPFCSCTCCSFPTVAQSLFHITFYSPFSPLVFNEYSQGDFIEISLPIWQPPKIG